MLITTYWYIVTFKESPILKGMLQCHKVVAIIIQIFMTFMFPFILAQSILFVYIITNNNNNMLMLIPLNDFLLLLSLRVKFGKLMYHH